jgi:hypothetical protein
MLYYIIVGTPALEPMFLDVYAFPPVLLHQAASVVVTPKDLGCLVHVFLRRVFEKRRPNVLSQ